MNRKIKRIISFLPTVFATIFLVVVICFIVELLLLFKCENIVTNNELKTNNLVKFATIEQLEKYLKLNPSNSVVSIKLAKIYEELGNFSLANKYYRDALEFSGRSYYALYSYALFCARQNMFAIASSLAEEISTLNNKTIQYRADIYKEIGDNMLKNGEYEASVKAYQIAYKYSKSLKNKNKYNEIKTSYSQAYIKLADSYIKKREIELAISALENSINIKENPSAKYKLGLIYIDSDKRKAQRLMESVLKEEPYIVNPYIYNKLLLELIDIQKYSFNQNLLNYYSVKHNHFKKTLKNLYLYKDDIDILNSEIKKTKEGYVLSFDLVNNTDTKIDQLYLNMGIFLNSKHYHISKKVVYLMHSLYPYGKIENYTVKLPSNFEFVDIQGNNYVIIKYFAKKSIKAPPTLIKIVSLNF